MGQPSIHQFHHSVDSSPEADGASASDRDRRGRAPIREVAMPKPNHSPLCPFCAEGAGVPCRVSVSEPRIKTIMFRCGACNQRWEVDEEFTDRQFGRRETEPRVAGSLGEAGRRP